MRPGIIAFLLILAAAPAHADDWNLFSPCGDAGFSEREREYLQETNRCDPRELARLHREFAAPPIAELAGEGGQAARVTVTDGYGNLEVVVEAVRPAGASGARAVARGRGDDARRRPQRMDAELERDAWEAIARRALEQAHARAAAPLAAEDAPIEACMHGWSVAIETFGFGQPRVMARNACDDREDGVFEFGWRTMRYVFAAFPDCAFLDQQFFRNDPARLSFCFALSGSISVAASATNAVHPFMYEAHASPRLRHLLAEGFTLTLDGEASVTGADAAFARWQALAASGDYLLRFDTASGAEDNEGRQTAQMTHLLIDDAWPNQNQARFAEVSQSWRRVDEVWLLQSMQVGPWRIVTFADGD